MICRVGGGARRATVRVHAGGVVEEAGVGQIANLFYFPLGCLVV